MNDTNRTLRLILEVIISVAIYLAIFEAIQHESLHIVIKLIMIPIGVLNGMTIMVELLKKKFGTTSFKGFGWFDRVMATIAMVVVFAIAATLSMFLSPFLIGEWIANRIFPLKEAPHEKLDQ